MADQASVKNDRASAPQNGAPEKRVVGGIAEFGNDVATLVELQVKLAQIDLKDCLKRASIPLALMAVALVFLLGAVPVLLLGGAELLAVALKITRGGAMLLTGGGVLALAVVGIVVGVLKLRPSFSSFQRSREELTRNLAWLRTVLLLSGRSLPNRRG